MFLKNKAALRLRSRRQVVNNDKKNESKTKQNSDGQINQLPLLKFLFQSSWSHGSKMITICNNIEYHI